MENLFYLSFFILCTVWTIEGILKLLSAWIEIKNAKPTTEKEDVYIPPMPTTSEDEMVVSLKQQQMYNVEKYKERMRKMREEEDEDGLFEEKKTVTLEDLGYFTGVESIE